MLDKLKLPGWVKSILEDATSVGATALQKWIDGEEYSWNDAANDFANKLIDRVHTWLNKQYTRVDNLSRLCRAMEKYAGNSWEVS